ncbi:hypothetical protein FW756_07230 [Leucobacter sp. 1207-22]
MHERPLSHDPLRREPTGVLRSVVREVAQDLLAVIWPAQCAGCGRADREVCDSCAQGIRACEVELTEVAGRWPLLVCGPYEGVVRDLLVRFKHADEFGLHRVLGDRLGVGLRVALRMATATAPKVTASVRGTASPAAETWLPPLIVPVPSRRSRVRSRGYAHVEVLVRRALRSIRRDRVNTLPHDRLFRAVVYRGLVATRGRTGQVGLTSQDRMRNARRIKVPARCQRILRGRQVVLVDDIVTTTATISAAAEALIGAGAQVTCVLAMCRAERKDSVEK